MPPPIKLLLLLNAPTGNNLGDDWIAEVVSQEIARRPNVAVKIGTFVFYQGQGNRLLHLPARLLSAWRRVLWADRVMIVGGNLLMPHLLRFALSLFFHLGLAALHHRPAALVAVGASWQHHPIGSWLMQRALSWCAHIWVRDEYSRQAVRQMFGREVDGVTCDAAFLAGQQPASPPHPGRNRLALVPLGLSTFRLNQSVVPLTDSEFLAFYDGLITRLRTLGNDLMLLVTDRVDLETAWELAQVHHLPLRVPATPGELLTLLRNEVDGLVAARMHAIIPALLHGKPVVGLNYQPKVRALSEGLAGVLPVLEFTPAALPELPAAWEAACRAAPNLEERLATHGDTLRRLLDELLQ